jgi:uncharacterized protein (DUF433 family)
MVAALSGATVEELSRWRHTTVLVPELSATDPVLYSFRDVVAVRMFTYLRGERSLLSVRQEPLDARTLRKIGQPFLRGDVEAPNLFRPWPSIAIDPGVHGGYPVVAGTRVPFDLVAGLVRDGVPPERVADYYPTVDAVAARDTLDFAAYVGLSIHRR